MSTLRTLAIRAIFPLSFLLACSSSGANGSPPNAGADAEALDGSLGPFVCGLPVPSTCPKTAPCAFASWGCVQAACDGYFVVTDGTWVYYYSSPGGELAGEVSVADGSFVSCPFACQPATSCTPAIASQCFDAGSTVEGGDP